MKINFGLIILLLLATACQTIVSKNKIIDKPIPVKNKTSRIWKAGWLQVPENRKNTQSNSIELPFVFCKNPDTTSSKPPVLIMSGGPGNTSLHMANGIVNATWAKDRDIIVLDQRGTSFTKPNLRCPEVDSMRILGIKQGFWGVALDSLKMTGVKSCYDRLLNQNIDLNGYNTLESVEDLEALRQALEIKTWVLYGMSYSCNLMATYAQTYPNYVAALILDSPLPHHINYDEDAYKNIDSILIRTIKYYTGNIDLYKDWTTYIEEIKDSVFTISNDHMDYKYTKNELCDILLNYLSDHNLLASSIDYMRKAIKGNHEDIHEFIQNALKPSMNKSLGMRYSTWISEELSEEKEENIKKQEANLPWLVGYSPNDVSFETAKHWPVNSIYENKIWPSSVFNGPAIILSGNLDPWTPDWYGKKVKEIIPNAVHLIYKEKSHLPGFSLKGMDSIHQFLNQNTQQR